MSVQKCKPSFDEGAVTIKRAPFTQLYNKVIQNCTNMEAIAIWAYLQSQCDDWQLNPNQLKKHFKIGKNKIYAILTFMISAKLLVRHVQTSANGRRICTTYTVLDGMEYIEPERVAQESAPLPQYPEMDNPEMENGDNKKERGLEKKDDQKDKPIIDSASDDAHANSEKAFNEFWEWYPIKKNKVRSKKIWEKKKYSPILTLILTDVIKRLKHDSQWQDKQFIPHPSTYLGNELWNDEITTRTPGSNKQGSGDAFSRVFSKPGHVGATYDEHGNAFNPFN